MARVKISWDGGEAVEYDGGQEWMETLQRYIYYGVKTEGLAFVSKGAGELQYETGVQGDASSVTLGSKGEGWKQLDIEDAIKEVNDNGC